MLGVGAGIWQPVTLGAKGALAGASLDMNFGGGAYLGAAPANLSVNRASTGYAKTLTGLLLPFGNNVARITDLGLLIEEGRTNIFLQSQTLGTAPNAFLNSTVQADQTAAPDGTNTADQHTDDATSGQHYLNQGITYAIGTYAFSVYAKAGTDNKLQLTVAATAFSLTPYANFDLATGTVSASGGGAQFIAATIEPMANGWYRCMLIAAADVAAPANTFVMRIPAIGSSRAPSYVGTGTTIFLWGAQTEVVGAGSSASSYIPTTSASVPRALDVVILSGTAFSSWYTGGAIGTIYCEADADFQSIGGINWVTDITNGGSNEEIFLLNNNAQYNGQTKVGGSQQSNLIGGSWPIGSSRKVALAYATGTSNTELVANGVSIGIGTSAAIPSVNQINFGTRPGASPALNGYIKRIAYFPSRLTQAAMIALTT
jgi:hypothetical protein